MTAVRRNFYVGMIALLLVLSACATLTPTPPSVELLGATLEQTNTLCDACD
jgi:hypothetical protein